MSPQATRIMRRGVAALAVMWALLALVLSVAGQLNPRDTQEPPIHTTGTGGMVYVVWMTDTAEAAGVEIGDRVLSVDGVPVNTWFRARGWENLREAQAIHYQLEKVNGSLFQVELAPAGGSAGYQRLFIPLYGASLLVGIAYLALGLWVFWLKPDGSESWAFVLFGSTIAMQLFSSTHTYDALLGYERMLVNLPFVGATALHFFTTFPVEPAWIVRARWLRPAAYAIAGLSAALGLLESAAGFPSALPVSLAFACAFSGAAIGLGVLTHQWRRARGTPDQSRVDLVFWGATLSFAPVLLLILAQLIFRVSFPTSLALLWFVILPITVAYGIVRNEFFDIRGMARSSAAYGVATVAITGLFALMITSADAAFARFNVNAKSPYFSVTFLFFAVLAFNPLRIRLQSVVDRFFDRDRTGYRDAVREISEAMVSMLSLDEVSDRLLAAVGDTMGVERAMVMIVDEEGAALQPVAWRGEWEEEALEERLPVDHPIGKHLWMRRQELTRADFDDTTDPETRELCREVFDQLEVVLLVPILFGVDLLGVIAIANKLTGDSLSVEDRQLLRTLANQSAIAIENAKAFDEIAKLNETLEARVEERTIELRETQAQLMQSEKMRSLGQLVAGVAHELNNPIGFVHANLQLLDGYFDKLVAAGGESELVERPREAIGKLLRRSREGTQRVKEIVQNLRAFSRMDQAELGEADLNEEIQRTLGLMEQRFKDGIEVHEDLHELPHVRCFPGQLNQVFMNLIMNAADALEGDGNITIRSRAMAEGVRLVFEDDGPGIPEAVRERMFEPFFTTKPVGKGTGLGLSISHGIVERHGGRMTVECPSSGGTHFVIDLPLVASPPEGDGLEA